MVTAGEIIGGSFRLVRERIGAAAVWALLYLAMTIAVMYAVRPYMTGLMALGTRTGGVPPDPATVFSGIGTVLGVYALMLVGVVILYTAALRAATRPEDGAYAYLRLGMDELRMLALGVIFVVGFFALYMVLVIGAGMIGGFVGVVSRDAAIPVIILLVLAVFAILVFFQVRLSLAFALTMLRGRIVIGEAWRLSRGRFWTLFGAYFVIVLIVFASGSLLFTISAGSYFADLARYGATPGGIQAAQQAQLARQFGGGIDAMQVVGWVLGAVLGTFWLMLGAGATGTAALALLDDAFADVGAIYE